MATTAHRFYRLLVVTTLKRFVTLRPAVALFFLRDKPCPRLGTSKNLSFPHLATQMPLAECLVASLQRDETRVSPAPGDRFYPLPANALHTRGSDGRKVILSVAGTRPECIKLSPVVRALADH